jgi:hypothetical protein
VPPVPGVPAAAVPAASPGLPTASPVPVAPRVPTAPRVSRAATMIPGLEMPARFVRPAAGRGRPEWTRNVWARRGLVAVGVIAAYFAARAVNRFRLSFAGRDAAIEALIPLMGVAEARKAVDRQHDACFQAHYRTGWVKWQDFSFTTGQHADCVMRRVMDDVSAQRRAAVLAAHKAAPAPRAVSAGAGATAPPPTFAPANAPGVVTAPLPVSNPGMPVAVRPPSGPAAQPLVGRVVVGNVRVLAFSRAPQLTVQASFVAIGSPQDMERLTMCSYTVECGGAAQGMPAGHRMVSPCSLRVQGAKAEGDLLFALPGPAPAEGSCSMELALTDGGPPRSNSVSVALAP